MNLQQSPTNVLEHPNLRGATKTRLDGRWLLLARVGWIVVTVTLVILNLIALPDTYGVYFIFTPQMLQDLQRLGLSPTLYSMLLVLEQALPLLVYLALGLLLFLRRSDERIALFCAFALVTFGSVLSLYDFTNGSIVPSLATNAVLRIVTLVLFGTGEASFVIFFYLFPSGRFVPRWTRWCALVVVVYWLAVVFFPALPSNAGGMATYFIPLSLLSAAVAQVYRYRHVSTPRERQQTKWAVFGFALAILILVVYALLGFLVLPSLRNDPVLENLNPVFPVAFLLIAIFLAIAVLRSRLWDIDLIIKRALIYSILTACVVGLYVLVVGYLGTLFHTGGNLVISLFATGLVAVLFQPLRGLLQRGVNRLFYGQRDEPYTVIMRLSRRLKETLEPDMVLFTIVETVAQALKLPYVAILWKQEETFQLAANYGTPVGEPLTLPLVYQAETIGQLHLAPRAPGETFTPADMRLLDELARQAGLATHAVRLATDLQKARERLVLAREEERRRLRRDLHDGIGPTLASLSQRIDTTCLLVKSDPDVAIAQLNTLKSQIKSTIADIRRVVYALRPPVLDELGLVSAIHEHILHLQGVNGLSISVDAPADMPTLPAAVEVAAYRIALEALTNVERHAHARHCLVRLELAGEQSLCLSISDDGRGLPANYQAGIGITSMRERTAELGGECTLTAEPGGRTHVQVRLPLKS